MMLFRKVLVFVFTLTACTFMAGMIGVCLFITFVGAIFADWQAVQIGLFASTVCSALLYFLYRSYR